MTLLVVGSTGTLGRQVVRRALDEGYKVRCLVRSPKKAAFLREWGAEIVQGNLCYPDTLPPSLEGITQIIDAATSRPTDSLSIKQVDWDGKVSLIQAAKAAGIERYIFFSFLDSDKFPDVPLMEIKRCTELFLAQSGLNYTVLQLSGFMQGLIGQYAIPILEKQAVWITGESSPVAYMDTQDIAKFAVRALKIPETENKTFPLVGTRPWSAEEIISLCERLSGQDARITRMPINLLRTVRNVSRFFQWGWNLSDRLAFAEVLATGKPITAPMEEVYQAFQLNLEETTTLESYMQEYFARIMKKLKELDYEKLKTKKKSQKKTPFNKS
ncbi:SDR family oxidoreductase [Chlorogloea sp. CCALA 695]|uniref:SDR family oxidoreductase n=1 Tax=Chlorogloea sp. CCALA 695 TaxID=2107693 RepID=UPI000D07C6BC|nr:SDR family oxidoreductase [Chlorogloea sp. CCALA 695]PSB29079.1 3-beta hydroxysteroid dehydrogenase [Chlorogloea sp. CCALA 695]